MSEYFQEEIRPYMARLQESRLRILPPEKGSKQEGSFSPEKPKKSKNALNERNDVQKTAELLTMYGVAPDEYIRMKRDREKQRSQWAESDVKQVVSHYLKAATYGGNPAEPQPSVICECCASINEYNKQQRKHMHATHNASADKANDAGKPGSRPHSPEHEPKRAQNPNEGKKVGFVGMGDNIPVEPAIPFFRSDHEGPDWVPIRSGNNQSYGAGVPVYNKRPKQDDYNYKDFLPDNKTVYVTHPVKKSLYSKWGVGEEVDGYNKDRHAAEDIVEASANYVDNMEKLKKYRDYQY